MTPKPSIQSNRFRERLWWLVLAPSTWAAHFLACYLTAAVWCAKSAKPSSLVPIQGLIAGYTVVAIVVIAVIGTLSFRSSRIASSTMPHDVDSPDEHAQFVGLAALLLSLLSFVATCFTALVFFYVRTCD